MMVISIGKMLMIVISVEEIIIYKGLIVSVIISVHPVTDLGMGRHVLKWNYLSLHSHSSLVSSAGVVEWVG